MHALRLSLAARLHARDRGGRPCDFENVHSSNNFKKGLRFNFFGLPLSTVLYKSAHRPALPDN